MSVTTAIEKFAEDIGFDIGQGSDDSQANLINGMARAFHSWQSGGDMQKVYMVDKLTKQGEEFILDLAKHVEAKRDA